MQVGFEVVEAKKTVTHPRTRPAHGSNVNRHPGTPVSPVPLDIPLGIPIQKSDASLQQASSNDFVSSPIGKPSRLGKRDLVSRLGKSRRTDRTLPPLRTTTAGGRFQLQDLPTIHVCPAPQCSRDQQRATSYQPNVRGKIAKISLENSTKRSSSAVNIPTLRLNQESPKLKNNRNNLTNKKSPSQVKTDKSLCLKSIDLNRELEAVSGANPGTNLTIALSRKPIVQRQKPQLTDEKHNLHIVSLSHLPLREVYLKPENAPSKEMANRQNRDRMSRILKWLKELTYLDEKAVEKGRYEVERTHFQLPEIKDSALIA